MRLLLLLMSDVHFTSKTDKVYKLSSHIASSVYSQLREVEKCVIFITGDITNKGTSEEFEVARDFFLEIKQLLEAESGKEIVIISVPGNHDCLHSPVNLVRSKIIESLKDADAKETSIVELCTSVQENYFSFREHTTLLKPVFEDKLWAEYELDLCGHPIRISALNASWMSTIHEKQGSLVFPIDNYITSLKEPAYSRFVLLHHPLNWYAQGSYHPLKQNIRNYATAVITGHEHHGGSGTISDSNSGSSLFFEAPALQPHALNTKVESGYLALDFDFANQKVTEHKFKIENYQSIKTDLIRTLSIETIVSHLSGLEDITQEFQNKLNEPGANFKSEDSILGIDDFYVFPELQPLKEEAFTIQDSEELLSNDPHGRKIFFLGESSSGKTTLLYQAFKRYRKLGYYPVIFNAAELKNTTELEIIKTIDKSRTAQYVNYQLLKDLPKEKLIILIDDIDRLRDGLRGLPKLIEFVNKHYSGILLSAISGFEFGELLDIDAQEATQDFTSYNIRPFGQWLKHRLIRKWCMCNNTVNTTSELEAKVHAAEKTLNVILGKNLVPGVPIYILILLQSIEKNQESALTNSHIGSYYGYMIDSSLREAGVLTSKMVEIKGYLSKLAWIFKSRKVREISLTEFIEFNRTYSDIQNTVDLNKRLEVLQTARIIVKREDYYSFTYPYIYYYFLGQYIAKNLSKDPILKDMVSEWCGSLQKQDNANCILFTAHHENDEWIINRVSEELDRCFEGEPEICFNGDIDSLNQLVEKTSTLIMEAPNVDKIREERLKSSDRLVASEDKKSADVENAPADIVELVNIINKSIITSRILGQILKGYYGDIGRSEREKLVNQIFSSQLRFLYHFISTLLKDPTALVLTIESGLEPLHGQTKSERIEEISQNIFQFLGLLCTFTLLRTAENVSSDDLKEEINIITDKYNTNAYRLIRAASSLIRPNALPFEELSKLSKDTEHNPFAFTLLQSLAAYHIRSFHLRDSDKQKLCATTRIELQKSRASDILTETIKPSIQKDEQ